MAEHHRIFHNLLILLVVYLIYGPAPSWNMLWIPVGLVLLGLNGLWICLLFGTLCARFRDVQPLVTSVLQITMFVTPIFWRPEMLGKNRAVFVDGNIVYHMIAIIRDPLLGKSPSTVSWRLALRAPSLEYRSRLSSTVVSAAAYRSGCKRRTT